MPERKRRLEEAVRIAEPANHMALILGGLSIGTATLMGGAYVQRTSFRRFKILYATRENGERHSTPDAEEMDLTDAIIAIMRLDPESFLNTTSIATRRRSSTD